jgi:hypothetical protein
LLCCCCSCCSSSSSSWNITQNTALLSNFTMLSAYCTMACTLALLYRPQAGDILPNSLTRKPCPAALPGSLSRQPCLAALPCSLARQSFPAALIAWQPGSLAEILHI